MVELVMSGGQTGADQAAWRAAVACNLPTGGWMPRDFLTEDGPRPEFAELYGAKEMRTPNYRLRTEQNVRDSDATIWFGTIDTPGAIATLNAIKVMGRPSKVILTDAMVLPSEIADWLSRNHAIKRLNVAGNRESMAPGSGARVEQFLIQVFRQITHPATETRAGGQGRQQP
jgi:Circularly permutated YpsA SLOG family